MARLDDEEVTATDDGQPELFYGSVMEFFEDKLWPNYLRKVGPQGVRRWSAHWWTNGEVLSRMEGIWRAWECLRLDPTTGISVWWRDHVDSHMAQICDVEGPFRNSEDSSENYGGRLPHVSPMPGIFTDVRREGR